MAVVFALLAAIALIFQTSLAHARSAPESFADLAEELLPMVVNVSTMTVIEGHNQPDFPQLPPGSPFEEFFKDFFERNQNGPAKRRATDRKSVV